MPKTNTPWAVRPATPDDVAIIAEFNLRMAMETESVALDPATLHRGVSKVLSDPAKGAYFVAAADRQVVGCLMITHEWSDWRDGDIWWIQSVYGDAAHRGRGVFRSLYAHVEQAARAAGARGLRLYVERENAVAQATYQAMGMSLTHYRLMEVMFGG